MSMPASNNGNAFTGVLRVALDRVREVSAADVIALYPYDAETDSFFAPLALGLGESDLARALPDITDQLRRFRLDEAQGKIPEELLPSHYGPHAWLLAMRRPLITLDAYHEADSTFVRRNKIQSIVALPLLIADRVVGLLYLNYVQADKRRKRIDVTDAGYLERVQETATSVAAQIDVALRADEAATLRTIGTLVRDLCVPPETIESNDASAKPASRTGTGVHGALQEIATVADFDCAALYGAALGSPRFSLVAAYGTSSLAEGAPAITVGAVDEMKSDEALVQALAQDGLYSAAVLAPHAGASQVALVVADRDAYAIHRHPPSIHAVLQTAAELIQNLVDNTHLLEALGESNRTLGAVTRLSNRLLQPGATQEDVLRSAAASLTDPALPELDFEFANLFLLGATPRGEIEVLENAGATTSAEIDSFPDDGPPGVAGATRRVPRWAGKGRRRLGPRDILTYVATRHRPMIVAARDRQDDPFIGGYVEEQIERIDAPITRYDGATIGQVHAARLRSAADRSPVQNVATRDSVYHLTDEFTLDAELFAEHNHHELVRIFMPFGHDETGERATGVLEAGYHISRKTRLERVQIEALRACVATVAVAVETARLYEDQMHRARQLEIINEVSRTIATSIDLEQTLHRVALNMARSVDASDCLIALMEEDDSSWYGAAASASDDTWRTRRVERSERSIVFEVVDEQRPVVVEDALNHPLVSNYFARLLNIRSLVALPLLAGDAGAIGAVLLTQNDRTRIFTPEEVEQAAALASQAAMAIRNARQHAREEEEQHIQKDVVLVGFGQWAQKAYNHLTLLKSFFNFRTHVVERDFPGRREAIADQVEDVLANGDAFYWDSANNPALTQLSLELEPSCYVITYIATPAETHLPVLKSYYDLSNVVLVEKPLGAPPEAYREFLDATDGTVEIVAADHYWFKIEVRLLQLLLTEERNLRAFLDEIEEVEIEILEEQPPGGSGAQIGMIADLVPHAFAVLSLLTPLDRLKLDSHEPLKIGRYQPLQSDHETYAQLSGSFDHRGRQVRVTIDVGKGIADAKWIKLSGERRLGGRKSFYKFDFAGGEAIDGTQSALRAATRPIRQPGVRDNAHLSMLRHVIEKKHPAVGILSIREALRANARIQELERMAESLLASGRWTPYEQSQRPTFDEQEMARIGKTVSGAGEEASGD